MNKLDIKKYQIYIEYKYAFWKKLNRLTILKLKLISLLFSPALHINFIKKKQKEEMK